jgi:hypothetical protein
MVAVFGVFAFARFSSESDFCCLAVLIAAENDRSISLLSPPVATRNTARSRCSSASHQSSPDAVAWASASWTASSASQRRPAECRASVFRASQYGTTSVDPGAFHSLIASSIRITPSAGLPQAFWTQPPKTLPAARHLSKCCLVDSSSNSNAKRSTGSLGTPYPWHDRFS